MYKKITAHTPRIFRALLLCSTILTTGCTTPQLPILQSMQRTLAAIQNTVTAWWNKTPQVVQELNASQASRENEFTTAYITDGIPKDIALIASRIDRILQDIEIINEELKKVPVEQQSILIEERKKRDADIIRFLKENDELLEQSTEKAMYKKDIKLYKFVNVLRTRAFLFERSI